MNEPLKICGVGRDAENEKALSLCFNRELTDDEIRRLHDQLREWLKAHVR